MSGPQGPVEPAVPAERPIDPGRPPWKLFHVAEA